MLSDKSLQKASLGLQLHSLVLPQLPEKMQTQGLVLDIRLTHRDPETGREVVLHQLLPYFPDQPRGLVLPGRPLFAGVMPPPEGLQLQVRALAIGHPGHTPLLYALDDDAVQAPFPMEQSCEQAVRALSALHENLARMFRSHPENAVVWESKLHLGFAADPAQGKLRTGTYVLVLVEDLPTWSWQPYEYLRESRLLVHRDTGKPLPQPHLLFSLQRLEE
jgi:hypothetical protein